LKRFGSDRNSPNSSGFDAAAPDRSAGRRIGYFSHLSLGDRHIGAILVTNQIGVPIEFKYTEPVTATRLHKVLYGAALERYLRENVIRDRLAAEVRSDPELYLTRFEERDFLARISGKEMVALERAHPSGADVPEPFTRVREREAVVGLDDGPALRLAFATPDGATQQQIGQLLQDLARTMDLLEPFERIKSALAMLCGEEKRGARSA
jgi:hypothetical protein